MRIFKQQTQNNIQFVNREFVIDIRSAKASHKLIKRLYENWLMNNAHNIFEEKIDKYSQILEAKTTGISIKNLKNGEVLVRTAE